MPIRFAAKSIHEECYETILGGKAWDLSEILSSPACVVDLPSTLSNQVMNMP